MSTMEIHFGALAPKLTQQLKSCGIARNVLSAFDLDATAIVRLHVRGVLSDSAVRQARKRLLKRIEAAWRQGPTS